MLKILIIPAVTFFNALLVALMAKLTELRTSVNLERRQELLTEIRLIAEQTGFDVVDHVSLLVAQQREVKLSIYNGHGCSKNHLTINMQLAQLIRMRGIAVCPVCGELLLRADHGEALAVYA